MKVEKIFDGIYRIGKKIATINLTPGERVYGEEIVSVDGKEYRIWDPWRSKPSAAIHNGLDFFPLKKGMNVLYLGIASGTTASHFSDIIGTEGMIYGVDLAERVLQKLIPVAEKRGNIIPILSDARKVENYENMILGKVDFLYEDVAAEDQVPIFIINAQKFLKKGSYAAISIKSQSISSTKDVKEIYRDALDQLKEYFEIISKVELDPYEKFHLFVVVRFK